MRKIVTRINLTHTYREDWKYYLSLHTADQERTRKMIQRFEADIPDIVVPPIPKYVKPEKKRLSIKEKIMYGYSFIAP